jgi:chemotaxis protein histidine kinase CheA
MDAVRRAVESLHGRIDVTSELGRGSTFALRLPLSAVGSRLPTSA